MVKYKFLETNTYMGDDICILIDEIKYVYLRGNSDETTIVVMMKDGSKYTEGFNDMDKLSKRYGMIKSIIGAK